MEDKDYSQYTLGYDCAFMGISNPDAGKEWIQGWHDARGDMDYMTDLEIYEKSKEIKQEYGSRKVRGDSKEAGMILPSWIVP